MKLSERILGINGPAGSDGWEVYYRARQMKAAGQHVINLSIGDHDLPTDPAIIDAMMTSARAGNTRYSPVGGQYALRREIAARVQARTGVPTGPENVTVTAGGQAALFNSLTCLCDPGDSVLFIDPHYATYPGTIRATGAIPRKAMARAEMAFQPQPDDLAALATGAKALLINTPNNPTGVSYRRQTLDGIAQVCRDHDMWLISDEVYDTLDWKGDFISARALPGMADRVATLGSLSKSHVMTGFRMGWIVGPAELCAAVTDLNTNTTYGLPGFIQDAAIAALRDGAAASLASRAVYERRRAVALNVLAGSNTLRLTPADGGMFVMLDARRAGLSGTELANRLLDDHAIAVMPGESFGTAAAGHLRVALTVPEDQLADALATIRAYVEGLSGQ